MLKRLCQLSRLGQFCQLKDIVDFIESVLMNFILKYLPTSL